MKKWLLPLFLLRNEPSFQLSFPLVFTLLGGVWVWISLVCHTWLCLDAIGVLQQLIKILCHYHFLYKSMALFLHIFVCGLPTFSVCICFVYIICLGAPLTWDHFLFSMFLDKQRYMLYCQATHGQACGFSFSGEITPVPSLYSDGGFTSRLLLHSKYSPLDANFCFLFVLQVVALSNNCILGVLYWLKILIWIWKFKFLLHFIKW